MTFNAKEDHYKVDRRLVDQADHIPHNVAVFVQEEEGALANGKLVRSSNVRSVNIRFGQE